MMNTIIGAFCLNIFLLAYVLILDGIILGCAISKGRFGGLLDAWGHVSVSLFLALPIVIYWGDF